jgi:uncharacterized membrane protein
MVDPAAFFSAAMSRRFAYAGGLLSVLMLLFPALAFLIADRRRQPTSDRSEVKVRDPQPAKPKAPAGATRTVEGGALPTEEHAAPFVHLLVIIGSLLVLAPEFIFLRDQFGSRLNTIFKFYYQAWLLLSLAAAFAVSVLLRKLRGTSEWVLRAVLVVLLLASLTYPVLALSNKTNGFHPPLGWTLDDFVRIQRGNPDEAAAILFLQSAPEGILVEAIGGSYSGFGRISEYTGLPAVLGWPGHESQWRGSGAPQGTRQDDVAQLYSTPNWETAHNLLTKYEIRYVYLGGLERSTYRVQEDKFQQNLSRVFQRGDVAIYQVP